MSGPRTIILGASHWHVPLYARAIAEEHQLIGISDDDVSLVQGLAEVWGAPVEADWRKLVAQLEDVMRPIWQAYDDQHGGREHV